MTPIRLDEPIVEPVTLAEMRSYLRLDPDDGGAEDALVGTLIASARATVEAASRRILVPGRYRIMLTAWPAEGWVPLPLSPLVSLAQAGTVDGAGAVTLLAPGLVRLGDDPIEAPGLVVSPSAPSLSGRAALIEVVAGHGGVGPSPPAPLVEAIRLLVAHGFEQRGDTPDALPPTVAALIAPWRRLRL